MSELVIAALITAIGSVVSGIIGAYVNKPPITGDNNKKINSFWGFLIGALIGAITIFIFLQVTGYIPPISFGQKFVTKLIIPSNNNLGFTYNIPQDGVYTFQYSDSAVAGWPSGEPPERWHTTTRCYRGSNVIWDGGGVDSKAALFEIGSGRSYRTRDEAIKASIGKKATAGFKVSEQITCVIADGRPDFGDNSGEVILDVFVSP